MFSGNQSTKISNTKIGGFDSQQSKKSQQCSGYNKLASFENKDIHFIIAETSDINLIIL